MACSPNSLNIIDLIEKNPITRLTSTYQHKLLEKIKESFTDTQQQLFVASFYCYLNYNQNNEFIIDLDNIWQWLDFSQKIRSKELLERNFVINQDYRVICGAKQERRGGHNKETILMTVDTFKLLCLKANTKKADEIHRYYMKLEKMLNETVGEECHELKTRLEQTQLQLEQSKETFKQELANGQVIQREQVLLKQFRQSGSLVYIIKVKTFENGQYVVKIGESRVGIEGRYTEHKKNYPECVLLDCYQVLKSKDFENFIHSHKHIRLQKVRDLPGHEKENELFLIGGELSYKTLIRVIEDNIKNYGDYTVKDFELLQTQNDLLQAQLKLSSQPNATKLSFENMIKPMQIQLDEIIRQNKELLEKVNPNQTKTTTGIKQINKTVGPRLQKINPDNLSLVKVYETVSEALTESNHKLKRSTIQGAVSENTVYFGFRWAYVERNLDPLIVNVPPTRQSKVQNLGYIAKMNEEKTEIVNVYIDRKTASTMNGFNSDSYLDTFVKNNRPVQGFFYLLFDNCPEELQSAFIMKNGPPLLYKDGVGRFDSKNNLLQEFTTKYHCMKTLPISDKTMTKTLDRNVLYNECYFRRLQPKLFC